MSAALACFSCCFLLVLCAAADVIRGLVRPLVTGRAAGWIPGGRPDPFTSSCLREKHGMTKLRGHHQSLGPEWLHLCYVCESGLYIYSRPTIDCTTHRLSSCQRAPHFSIAYLPKRLTRHQTIRPSHDTRHHSSLAPHLPSAARRQTPKHRTISLLPTVCNNPWIASSTPTAY